MPQSNRFRHFAVGLLLTSIACLAPSRLSAQDTAGLVVDIDAKALVASGLIDRVLRMHDDRDISEIKQLAETYKEVMGIDVFKDIQRIRFEASQLDFAAIEDDPARVLAESVLQVRLTQPGNLEGLLLAAPDYSSEEASGHRIHSCRIPDIGRLHVVFIPDSNKAVDVIGGFNVEAIKKRLGDGARRNSPSDRSGDAEVIARIDLAASETKRIRDPWLAELDDEDDPAAAIVRNVLSVLGDISVRLEKAGAEMRIVAQVGVTDKARVEQLRQLAKGGMALMSILAQEHGDRGARDMLRNMTESTEIRSEDDEIIIVVPLKTAMDLLEHLGLQRPDAAEAAPLTSAR